MRTTRNYGSGQPVSALAAPDSSVAIRRSVALIGLLTFEASAVTSLRRLGSVAFLRLPGPDAAAWREWMQFGNASDVLAALTRVAALGAAWWLLVSTILYLAARLHRSPYGIRIAGRLVPAVVRRFVDGMVVVSVAGALAGGRTGVARVVGSLQPPAGWTASPIYSAEVQPASSTGAPPDPGVVLRADLDRGILYPLAPSDRVPAASPGPPVAPAPASPAPPSLPSGARSVPSSDIPSVLPQIVPGGILAPDALLTAPPALAPPPSPSEPAGAPPTAAGGQQAQDPPGASSPPGVPHSAGDAREGSALWTVQPGESLWAMAARGVGAPRSDDSRIGRYWIQVVAANRETIASGDPDLIHPGETIVMPPLPQPGPDGR